VEGDDVATIFKGMQLDIGAPPQFMDFRYTVADASHGTFALASCGALMDVEPYGETFVVNMCHHIEDPTFDATAAATNPRARMRPIHRPPRVPAGRLPMCEWTVVIEEDADPLPMPAGAERLLTSRAAATVLDAAAGPDSGGRTDYAGALVPDIRFEEFSHHTLVALAQEICLQGHLLTLTFSDALERRSGRDAVLDIARRRLAGIAGIAARRLTSALGIDDGREGLVRGLRLHPAFHPHAYIAVDVADDLTVTLRDCPALGDRPGLSWADSLDATALDAIVREIDPTARVSATGERSWRVERGAADPAEENSDVKLASFSTGATFAFEDR
jgi:hypothetical protein